MNSKSIIKKLEAEGWYKVGIVGSHHHYKHPTVKGKITIPHPKKDLAKGLVNSIYKQAGWY